LWPFAPQTQNVGALAIGEHRHAGGVGDVERLAEDAAARLGRLRGAGAPPGIRSSNSHPNKPL
jgi:hypothetical protein